MLFKHIKNPKVLMQAQQKGIVGKTGYVNCKGNVEYQVLNKKQLTTLFKGKGWDCVHEVYNLSSLAWGKVELHYYFSGVNQTLRVRAYNEEKKELPFLKGSLFNKDILEHSQKYWKKKTQTQILQMAARDFHTTWEPSVLCDFDDVCFQFLHYSLEKGETFVYPFQKGIEGALNEWISNHPRGPKKNEIAIITHKGKKFMAKVMSVHP